MNWDMNIFEWRESLIWLGKLTLATLLGGAIGFERESHGQSAGFRTNILVALGSCLMMMLSLHLEELFHDLSANSVVRLDPGRIASYAIASMGFLGGGAIIKGKGSVRGLTTAAGLWLVTGIGLAVGAGYLLPAIYTAFISLLILYNLRRLKFLFSHDVYSMLTITCIDSRRQLGRIKKVLKDYQELDLRFVNFSENIPDQIITYRLHLCGKEHLPWGEIIQRLLNEVCNIKDIKWEESDVP